MAGFPPDWLLLFEDEDDAAAAAAEDEEVRLSKLKLLNGPKWACLSALLILEVLLCFKSFTFSDNAASLSRDCSWRACLRDVLAILEPETVVDEEVVELVVLVVPRASD